MKKSKTEQGGEYNSAGSQDSSNSIQDRGKLSNRGGKSEETIIDRINMSLGRACGESTRAAGSVGHSPELNVGRDKAALKDGVRHAGGSKVWSRDWVHGNEPRDRRQGRSGSVWNINKILRRRPSSEKV